MLCAISSVVSTWEFCAGATLSLLQPHCGRVDNFPISKVPQLLLRTSMREAFRRFTGAGCTSKNKLLFSDNQSVLQFLPGFALAWIQQVPAFL
ncbi:hypothetical protein EV426DRAFT_3305 [Tirmania nivea]|nr:hypothetical protein EV426DRAFT_3305 [Tirmania nivea]